MPYVGIGVDLWTRLIQRESLHVQRKSPEMVDPEMIIKNRQTEPDELSKSVIGTKFHKFQ